MVYSMIIIWYNKNCSYSTFFLLTKHFVIIYNHHKTTTHRYRERRSSKQACIYVLSIWCISLITCTPPLFGWNDLSKNYILINNVTKCILFDTPSYVIYSSSFSFYIPFLLTILLYVQIFVILRKRLRSMRKKNAKRHDAPRYKPVSLKLPKTSDSDSPIKMLSPLNNMKDGKFNKSNKSIVRKKTKSMGEIFKRKGLKAHKSVKFSNDLNVNSIFIFPTEGSGLDGGRYVPQDGHSQNNNEINDEILSDLDANFNNIKNIVGDVEEGNKKLVNFKKKHQKQEFLMSRINDKTAENICTRHEKEDNLKAGGNKCSGSKGGLTNETKNRKLVEESDRMFRVKETEVQQKNKVVNEVLNKNKEKVLVDNKNSDFDGLSTMLVPVLVLEKCDSEPDVMQSTVFVQSNENNGCGVVRFEGLEKLFASKVNDKNNNVSTSKTIDQSDQQDNTHKNTSINFVKKLSKDLNPNFQNDAVKKKIYPHSISDSTATTSSIQNEKTITNTTKKRLSTAFSSFRSNPSSSSDTIGTSRGSVRKTVDRRSRSDRREMRATIRMAAVIAAFCIMWLGFFTLYLVEGVCKTCSVPRTFSAFLFWLGYSNSAINPILYAIFNDEFRKAFKKILGIKDKLKR